MTTEIKPRWTRRKDSRPQELLSAALDLFVEHGYAATKLSEVAQVAGVSKGTLYLYFENKEELFKAVVRETIVPNIAEAEQLIVEFEGPTRELFKRLIRTWFENINTNKLSGIAKLMFAESSNFPELAEFYRVEVIDRNELMLIQLLNRGMLSGEFKQLDLAVVPKIITAPIIMMMLWNTSFKSCAIEPILTENYIESYVDIMLAGLLKSN
ncbi:TetR/AcrR family transcriptional regulator [Sapientia aquatica]|uniref:TetR/AcrR family transcriptional regulator n=1 Tax=Sapientia aquatica TaxID=1549640 RepID=A0A4R5W4S0_9BURK|nr:TetR/AcrR family transcriptional regulator [Sapientia aquatica]TDK68097.1 TetR/AcrR family transcriptional regulator [Sapientia aquatica]